MIGKSFREGPMHEIIDVRGQSAGALLTSPVETPDAVGASRLMVAARVLGEYPLMIQIAIEPKVWVFMQLLDFFITMSGGHTCANH